MHHAPFHFLIEKLKMKPWYANNDLISIFERFSILQSISYLVFVSKFDKSNIFVFIATFNKLDIFSLFQYIGDWLVCKPPNISLCNFLNYISFKHPCHFVRQIIIHFCQCSIFREVIASHFHNNNWSPRNILMPILQNIPMMYHHDSISDNK